MLPYTNIRQCMLVYVSVCQCMLVYVSVCQCMLIILVYFSLFQFILVYFSLFQSILVYFSLFQFILVYFIRVNFPLTGKHYRIWACGGFSIQTFCFLFLVLLENMESCQKGLVICHRSEFIYQLNRVIHPCGLLESCGTSFVCTWGARGMLLFQTCNFFAHVLFHCYSRWFGIFITVASL